MLPRKRKDTLEERLNSTKPLDDLREQESEIAHQNQEDEAVILDKTASPSEKEAAGARVAVRAKRACTAYKM